MKLYPIKLSAKADNWRLFTKRKADPAFLAFQKKILHRDRHTCRFCGFRAHHFQEVVNLDNNYYNNRADNLLTACRFCAQCFFLEAIGKDDFGGGSLIYLPEVTQGELNALCHVMFSSMMLGNSYRNQAKNIYRSLKLGSQPVEEQLGEGMSNPALLGHILIDSDLEDMRVVNTNLLPKLRVLPNIAHFLRDLEVWTLSGLEFLAQQ